MNNINFELYGKNVKVITIYGDEIIGNFEEDFEEEQEIAINKVIVRYDEVKEMFEFNENIKPKNPTIYYKRIDKIKSITLMDK